MENRKRSKPLTNAAGEVRELTSADMARFKPAREVLPADLMKTLGRPVSSNPRQLVSIRLPADVLAKWKATGPGWQTRLSKIIERARVK